MVYRYKRCLALRWCAFAVVGEGRSRERPGFFKRALSRLAPQSLTALVLRALAELPPPARPLALAA